MFFKKLFDNNVTAVSDPIAQYVMIGKRKRFVGFHVTMLYEFRKPRTKYFGVYSSARDQVLFEPSMQDAQKFCDEMRAKISRDKNAKNY